MFVNQEVNIMSRDFKSALCMIAVGAMLFFLILWDTEGILEVRMANVLNFPF
jgi:hypothetical protein